MSHFHFFPCGVEMRTGAAGAFIIAPEIGKLVQESHIPHWLKPGFIAVVERERAR
jgi:hypothetical protein